MSGPATATTPVWHSLQKTAGSSHGAYADAYVPQGLIAMARMPPRVVLDVGCYVGATGAFIKSKYPAARVIGIEPTEEVARVAAERIDDVYCCTFDNFPFEEAGIAHGTLDTVILADVLEHMYDPWSALVALRPYLSPDAQVLASIPNVRNLWLLNELASGRWAYEASGLLDVTHIRFFTLETIRQMLGETGYRVEQVVGNGDHRLLDAVENVPEATVTDVRVGKVTVHDTTGNERAELATLQWFMRISPAIG